ncbi:MAG: quinol:electron acceptor oxidoreductase subunit ActD [Myxococcales bacterium]
MAERGVLGFFGEPERAARAIRALRAAGLTDVRAAMPAPFPEVLAALGRPRSRVGIGVFAGTAAGVVVGYALCAATSSAWPLVTGGKPILSWPAFTVIAFEVAVLIGGLTTHAILAYDTATGRSRHRVPLRAPGFSQDRIGIFVVGTAALAEQLLRTEGAEGVERVE